MDLRRLNIPGLIAASAGAVGLAAYWLHDHKFSFPLAVGLGICVWSLVRDYRRRRA